MQSHEIFLDEINKIFEQIRKEKSYKVAGVPNASLKVKCSVCGREIEFAHCVYDLEKHKIVCFRCFEQPTLKYKAYESWLQEFSYDNYF